MNEKDNFDFSKEPGIKLNGKLNVKIEYPLISIITPYYNVKNEYLMQTANCIFNQTFPFWEWIIVDDCSKKENQYLLEKLSKKDERIKVFYNKENLGLPGTRDFAISKSTTDLIYILDPDDLIENTALETAYFSIKTHPDVTWVYSDVVGFGTQKYLWNPKFDTFREKKENLLCCNALIKKDAVLKVGGYSNVPKNVYEDWHLWLRMLAEGAKPLKMSYYSFWYRRHDNGVLTGINSKKKFKKAALMEIHKVGKKINKKAGAIQYPNSDEYDSFSCHPTTFNFSTPILKEKEESNKNLLFIFPWMTLGGADKFNLNLLEKLYKDGYNITIITTDASRYVWRQKFEECASEIFDLTTFLDRKDWPAFISYLVKSRNVNLIFQSNSLYGYYLIPWLKINFPEIPIIDYIHMEEWYWRDGGYPRDSIAIEKYIDYTYTCSKHLINVMKKDMNKQKDNIDVVYIGTEQDKFDPQKVKSSDNILLNKISDKKKVIFPCRIAQQKRPYLMIEILKKLLTKRKDIAFVVVGDGKLLKGVKNKANEYGINDNIVFIPSQSDIREYYKIADVTLICSMIEGLSLTAYESLSMGVPVITSDVGGQKELVSNDCGRIVKLYQNPNKDIDNYKYSEEEINAYVDAIIEIIDNPEVKNNCRKRILDFFTVNKMQEKMEKIISDTIKNGTKVKYDDIKDDYNLAERYLVLFNDIYRKNYVNPDDPNKSGNKIVNKLWKYKSYRRTIRFLQKTGIIKVLKVIKK